MKDTLPALAAELERQDRALSEIHQAIAALGHDLAIPPAFFSALEEACALGDTPLVVGIRG